MIKMDSNVIFTPAERRCAQLIPALASWTVEHAWLHQIEGTFDAIPTWCLVDMQSVTLENPCGMRVAAAWVWNAVKTRDMMQFEKVLELLDVFHTLLPQLVTPIKHMKVVFGLKTVIIMWMFRENQSAFRTIFKINRFFPDKFPQYHGCSHSMETLMRKTHHDFKAFAQLLATKREVREAYLKEHVEEQYGERYAQRLDERLFHYLQELEAKLPPTTNIERVLEQECPLVEGEALLKNMLSCSSALVPEILRRLQLCAISISSGSSETNHQCSMPRIYTEVDQSPNPSIALVGQSLPCIRTSQQTNNGTGFRMTQGGGGAGCCPPSPMQERYSQPGQRMSHFVVAAWEERPLQLCSRHCRWVRNILQGCSEEGRSHGGGVVEDSSEEGRSHGGGVVEDSSEEGRSHSGGVVEDSSEEVRSHAGGFVEDSSEEGWSHGGGVVEESSEEGRSHSGGVVEDGSEEGRSHGGGVVEESSEEGRSHGGGIVEDSSEEGRSHGGGVVEDSSEEGWHHGGGIVEKSSEEGWRHGGGATEESSKGRSHGGGVADQSSAEGSRCFVHGESPDFLTVPTLQHHPAGLSERIRLSVESQLILIQSRYLQPLVRLRRLTEEECRMTTDQSQSKEEASLLSYENSPPFTWEDSLFTGSSSSDSEGDSDPEYIL